MRPTTMGTPTAGESALAGPGAADNIITESRDRLVSFMGDQPRVPRDNAGGLIDGPGDPQPPWRHGSVREVVSWGATNNTSGVSGRPAARHLARRTTACACGCR